MGTSWVIGAGRCGRRSMAARWAITALLGWSLISTVGCAAPIPEGVEGQLAELTSGDMARSDRARDALVAVENTDGLVRSLARILRDTTCDYHARWRAAEILGRLRPPSAEAARALMEASTFEDLACICIESLGEIGWGVDEAILPCLIDALGNESWLVRGAAADAIGKMGPEAIEAIPALVAACRDRDVFVRISAAGSLGAIKAPTSEVVAVLCELVERQWDGTGVVNLGQLGPGARAGVPILERLLVAHSEAVPGPSVSMAGPDEIIVALGRIGPAARQAVPSILAAAQDDDSHYFKEHVAWALGEIGADDPASVALLLRYVDDNIGSERSEAAKALDELRRMAPVAVPALMEMIRRDGGKPYSIEAAIAALGHIGPPASEAAPLLRQVLANVIDHHSPAFDTTGEAVVVALGRIVTIDAATAYSLAEATWYDDRMAREYGETSLHKTNALAALACILRDGDVAERRRVADVMVEVETDDWGSEVIGAITGAVRRDPDTHVRKGAVLLLGMLMSERPVEMQDLMGEPMDPLLFALSDPDQDVATAAARAIGWRYAKGEDALPMLRILATRPDLSPKNRETVEWAFDTISEHVIAFRKMPIAADEGEE